MDIYLAANAASVNIHHLNLKMVKHGRQCKNNIRHLQGQRKCFWRRISTLDMFNNTFGCHLRHQLLKN